MFINLNLLKKCRRNQLSASCKRFQKSAHLLDNFEKWSIKTLILLRSIHA